MTAKEKLTKARAGLILDLPFFGSLALRLTLQEDPSCETAWTDGKSMGYNPDFIESLSLDQVKGLICHEVMHCACAHQARRGDRNHQKWNIAGDYAINQIIEDAKITLPEGHLIDPAYKGMNADEIYSKLPNTPPAPSQEGNSRGTLQRAPAGVDKGVGNDPGRCGEVRDAESPKSEIQNAQSEQDWKVAVAQAAQEARMQGKLPAGLDRLVTDILEPKVDWREVLRRFVDQSAKNDYQWFPPNRRYIHQRLYLPSLKSEELPPIVIAIDTSGSIGKEELDQFAVEMTAILEDHHTSCTVIYCDARIANVEEFSSDDLPLQLHPKGGGGTDFRPSFDYVGAQCLVPSCMIYLTDLECSSYPSEPPYPVLWARIGKGGTMPPFGEEVQLC